ncbi:MAG: sigma-70 family RNA polymerase sigma factor [Myxococcota bacterium]
MTREAQDGPTLNAGTLFRRHGSFVANFVARLGVDRSELDDVVQDVFMIAHRHGGFRPGAAKPTTWLADIAMKVNANRRRSKRRARVKADGELVDRATDGAASPADIAEHRQSIDRVQQALDSLDEDRRAVFVLFEMEGESCEAIAAGLKIPLGTVYSRLHHARKKFRKAHARLSAADNRVRAVVTLVFLFACSGLEGWS